MARNSAADGAGTRGEAADAAGRLPDWALRSAGFEVDGPGAAGLARGEGLCGKAARREVFGPGRKAPARGLRRGAGAGLEVDPGDGDAFTRAGGADRVGDGAPGAFACAEDATADCEDALAARDEDASARAENLTREEALSAMTGTPFVERRRADMTRTLTRYERLSADRDALTSAGPFTRAYLIAHSTDQQIARATAEAYKPALPLTFEGLTFAAIGLVLGTLFLRVISEIASILLWPFRRMPT